MKEFCIEINESQPLEKVEAKLKELGYRETAHDIKWNDRWRQSSNFVFTYHDGTYRFHIQDECDYNKELLTLGEL